MTARPVTTYTRRMILPERPDLGILLVRTDYSDDVTWNAAFACNPVYESDDFDHMGAGFQTVESPELADLAAASLLALQRADYLSAIAVADTRTMKDHTQLFVDFDELYGEPGRTVRAIPEEAEAIGGEPFPGEHGHR
jgi:Domain of unknown function (DUF6924)